MISLFFSILILVDTEALQTEKMNNLLDLEMGFTHSRGSLSVILSKLLFVAL